MMDQRSIEQAFKRARGRAPADIDLEIEKLRHAGQLLGDVV